MSKRERDHIPFLSSLCPLSVNAEEQKKCREPKRQPNVKRPQTASNNLPYFLELEQAIFLFLEAAATHVSQKKWGLITAKYSYSTASLTVSALEAGWVKEMLLRRAFISHWYQTNLKVYAVKTLINISFFKNNPNKDFKKNSIFPSVVRAELNYLCSIGQVMHASSATLSSYSALFLYSAKSTVRLTTTPYYYIIDLCFCFFVYFLGQCPFWHLLPHSADGWIPNHFFLIFVEES